MRTIIAGSRSITEYRTVLFAILDSGFNITQVVSGGAKGVDILGERFANECSIPIVRFPAQWDLYGKSARYRRNVEMSKSADALIAIWDQSSPGTRHMIDIAVKANLKIFQAAITNYC